MRIAYCSSPHQGGILSRLYSAKGREANVLVQDLDLGEPDLTQKVQLKKERSWGVFLLDVGEHMVPVRFVLEAGQVVAIPRPHQSLDRRDRTLDQIEDPDGAVRPQRTVERCENIPPFRVRPKVVQHGRSQNNVEGSGRKHGLSNVALNG